MEERDAVLDEQISYYSARAPSLDDTYTRTGTYDDGPEANAQWLEELAIVRHALAVWPCTGDVLELGCGTGFWTALLAPRVRSLTAFDASSEMLALARRRLAGHPNVEFQRTDLIRNWTAVGQYDGAAAFFFLEHVPDSDLPALLRRVADALRPGAALFVAEGRFLGPYGPIEHRKLGGASYRVVERRRSPDEFAAAFAAAGLVIDIKSTARHFCYGAGERRRLR